MALYKKKSQKLWILKAYDRHSKRTITWVTGRRDIATVQKLYNQLKNIKKCRFYTDNWEAYSSVLPAKRHYIGKKYTHLIESDHANTRHHLARFTRRTKVVSHSEKAVNDAIKLWLYTQQENVLESLLNVFVSLFM